MKCKKILTAFVAVMMLMSAVAFPVSAQSVLPSSMGEIHVEGYMVSVPYCKVVTVRYNGRPYGTYAPVEEVTYRYQSFPSGTHPVLSNTREVVDFINGFPSGNDGELKSKTHYYYTYVAAKD